MSIMILRKEILSPLTKPHRSLDREREREQDSSNYLQRPLSTQEDL